MTPATITTVRRVARIYAWRWNLDADDVEGEALLQLWQRPSTVIGRMVHQVAVSHVRHRNVRMRLTAHVPMSQPLMDPSCLDFAEAWAGLTEEDRAALLAADHAPVAVRRRQSRAKRRLAA